MRGSSDGTPAPDFDETRHASICTEVLAEIYPSIIVTEPSDIVEVSLCCHHTSPKESVVFGQL